MDQGYSGLLLARRSRLWSGIATALFLLLAVRLGWVQVVRHAEYSKLADETISRHWPIRAERGNIYDTQFVPLALNLKLYSIGADPKLIHDPKLVADFPAALTRLAALLRMPEEELTAKLAPTRLNNKGVRVPVRFAPLRENVDEQVAEAVRRLGVAGLVIAGQSRRAYPHGTVGAALLGFVGHDMKGLGGIEGRYDKLLAGIEGRKTVMLDGRLPRSRTPIPGRTITEKEMVPGSSIVLTIDLTLQSAADEALAAAVKAAHAKGGTAVVMNPTTGEVLALANQPTFDPNDYGRSDPNTWVSQAVVSPYEPGSTFKTVTACAALEEGVMSHGETVTCTGSKQIGNRTINCARHGGSSAHGTLDLDHMLIKSCNVGFGTVALKLGPERLYKWIKALGFGARTGIELPSESPGQLSSPDRWSQIQLANVGFGQGASVTAVQLLAAYCTIANGGYKVEPRLVRLVMAPGQKPKQLPAPPRVRVISPETSARLRRALQGVVDEGTGEAARLPGRTVAGKTGTAQKATPGAGYRSGKYIGSFVGFAPVNDPKLAVIVAINEPGGSHYGGVIAAPAFAQIMERGLSYYHVPPDAPLTKSAKGGHGAKPAGSVAE